MLDVSKLPKYSAVDGALEQRDNGEFVNVNDLTAAVQAAPSDTSESELSLAHELSLAQAEVATLTAELSAIRTVLTK